MTGQAGSIALNEIDQNGENLVLICKCEMVKRRPSKVSFDPSIVILSLNATPEMPEQLLEPHTCYVSCSKKCLGRFMRVDLIAHRDGV
jgi:hypothetical protein